MLQFRNFWCFDKLTPQPCEISLKLVFHSTVNCAILMDSCILVSHRVNLDSKCEHLHTSIYRMLTNFIATVGL